MKKISLILASILVSLVSQADSWVSRDSFPVGGRNCAFSFSLNGKGYMGCGLQFFTGAFKDCWEYDPVADSWTQMADYGGPACWYAVGFAISSLNKGYVGLGYYNSIYYRDFWEFDPVANIWTQKNNFPYSRRLAATAISTDTKGYIAFGEDTSGVELNDLCEYDPISDSWSLKTPLPAMGRLSATGFSIGSKIYIGTGASGQTVFSDFYEYDIPSDSWTIKASYPGGPIADAASFSILCKGYLGTGETQPWGTYQKQFWEYDPASDSWTQKSDYAGLETNETVCFSIGNKGYLGLGGAITSFSDFWVYYPDTSCIGTPIITNFIAPTTLCPGNCISFQNLSVNASTYQWYFQGAAPDTSTLVNPTNICYVTPGSYDVQLIASDSINSDTLLLPNYITVFPFPPAQSITQIGDTLFSIAGSATYQWYFNANIINGATNYFYVIMQSGDYNLIATDSNGCEVEAVINDVLAAVVSGSKQSVQIYPNPVTNKVTIQNLKFKSGAAVEISIYNMIGEKVTDLSPLSFEEGTGGEADVSGLPDGMYWLNISSDGKIFRTKFVKQ